MSNVDSTPKLLPYINPPKYLTPKARRVALQEHLKAVLAASNWPEWPDNTTMPDHPFWQRTHELLCQRQVTLEYFKKQAWILYAMASPRVQSGHMHHLLALAMGYDSYNDVRDSAQGLEQLIWNMGPGLT